MPKFRTITGGGLHLFVTPDPNRPGKAASKLWRMAYSFNGRQKTSSMGAHSNGDNGTVSLVSARQKRDAAKVLLAQNTPVDPSIEKQVEKHRQRAERPFSDSVDDWLVEKRTEKIKRGNAAIRNVVSWRLLDDLPMLPLARTQLMIWP